MQTLLNIKQIIFKHWTTIQLYAQSNLNVQLKMTANKKGAISPVPAVSSEFQKILSWYVQLPRQAEIDRVEQFRHDM